MREPKNVNAKGGTRDVNAAQRAIQALQLRAAKVPYDRIAKQCGYSDRGHAHRAVQRELDRVVVENVTELRREECNTLDIIQEECMKLFLDKANKARLFAADRILAVMERRARLMGLDTPVDQAQMSNVVVIRETPAGYLTPLVAEAAK